MIIWWIGKLPLPARLRYWWFWKVDPFCNNIVYNYYCLWMRSGVFKRRPRLHFTGDCNTIVLPFVSCVDNCRDDHELVMLLVWARLLFLVFISMTNRCLLLCSVSNKIVKLRYQSFFFWESPCRATKNFAISIVHHYPLVIASIKFIIVELLNYKFFYRYLSPTSQFYDNYLS